VASFDVILRILAEAMIRRTADAYREMKPRYLITVSSTMTCRRVRRSGQNVPSSRDIHFVRFEKGTHSLHWDREQDARSIACDISLKGIIEELKDDCAGCRAAES